MPTHPEVLWTQRSSTSDPKKNIIYLTINLPDIIESTLQADLTATGLKFKAKAGNEAKGLQEKEYEFAIEFFAEVDPAESSQRLNLRALDLVLRKKELQAEYWPKLYKGAKLQFVKTNFSKWVDEDEQDEAKPAVEDEEDFNPMGGMPGPGMPGGGGGMFGPGGMTGPGGGMFGPGGMAGPGGGGGDMFGSDMDFEKMLAGIQMNKGESSGSGGAPGEDDSDDDDGPPPLEDAPPVGK